MMWIDDKYKQKFDEQRFPESVKKAAWEKAKVLLDEEMPVKKNYRLGFYGTAIVILLLLVPGIWWMTQREVPDNPTPESTVLPSQESEKTEESTTGSGDANSAGMEQNTQSGDLSESSGSVDMEGSSKEGMDIPQGNDNTAEQLIAGQSSAAVGAITPMVAGSDPGQVETTTGESAAANEVQSGNSLEPSAGIDVAGESADDAISDPAGTSAAMPAANNPEVAEPADTDNNKMENQPEEGVSGNDPTVTEIGDENQEPEAVGIENTEEKPQEDELNDSGTDENDPPSEEVADPDEEFLDHLPKPVDGSFTLNAWGGYFFTDKTLSSTYADYAQSRNESESAIMTPSFGLTLDYKLNRSWYMSSGLWWTQYGEEFSYDNEREIETVIDSRYNHHRNFDNIIFLDSARVIDSINVGHWDYTIRYIGEDSTGLVRAGRTHIRYIEVPLLIGYQFGKGPLNPWVRTGVSFGFPIGSSFQYINENSLLLEANGDQPELSDITYNYILNLGLDYNINEFWGIRFSALGTLHLSSVLKDPAISQNYYRFGAQLGFFYKF